MLYVGLDLSRKRLDIHALEAGSTTIPVAAVVAPDVDGLHELTRRFRPPATGPCPPLPTTLIAA